MTGRPAGSRPEQPRGTEPGGSSGPPEPAAPPVPSRTPHGSRSLPRGSRRAGSKGRRVLAGIGRGLISAGVLILLFVAYQLWGTNLAESHSQDLLRQQFDRELATQREGGRSSPGPSRPVPGQTVTQPGRTVPVVAAPPDGQAVGTIQISKIGVDKVVVEGTSTADLRKGPAHYPGTPLPGQPGNAAIAGHRTTYGAPFYNLDQLSGGDPIVITTTQGTFRYDVSRSMVVAPTDVGVAAPTTTNQLTLTTCNPRFSASQRLVVQATLVGSPRSAPPSPNPTNQQTASGSFSVNGLGGASGNWVPAMWWGLLAAATFGAVWFVGRQLGSLPRRIGAYAAGAPVFLLVLFIFFENVSPLLPASF